MRRCDFLLLLDVIEHVKEPERLIGRIRAQFDYSPPTLVLTTPNIAFVVQRHADARPVQLRQGGHPRPYAHTRLFTFRSLRRLLTDAGFRIMEMRGVPAPFRRFSGPARSAAPRWRSIICSSA